VSCLSGDPAAPPLGKDPALTARVGRDRPEVRLYYWLLMIAYILLAI